MFNIEDAKIKLTEIKKLAGETEAALGVEQLKSEMAELKRSMESPEVWNNAEEAKKIGKKLRPIEDKLLQFDKMMKRIDDAEVMVELL